VIQPYEVPALRPSEAPSLAAGWTLSRSPNLPRLPGISPGAKATRLLRGPAGGPAVRRWMGDLCLGTRHLRRSTAFLE
jgi:hypothetical protein